MFKKLMAVLLCMCLAFAVLVPAVSAANVVVDTSGLWGDIDFGDGDDDAGNDNTGDNGDNNTGDDNTGDDNTGDDNTGDDNTGDNGSDDEGDDNQGGNNEPEIDDTPTYIPDDNKDKEKEEIQVVAPKDDKDDNKTTVLPSGGTTKPEETKPEETKPEEKDDTADVKKPAAVENAVKPKDFSDVKAEDWFYSDVRYLAGMGVINGYLDGTFRPEDNVTRAEFIKLLVSMMVEEGGLFTTYEKIFDDVETSEWYSDYIVSALVYGIIDPNDYGATFGPDEFITRREVSKLIVNALQVEAGGFKTPYADTSDHNIIALYGLGLMQGNYDPTTGARFFYPDTQITRAETAAVILRIFKLASGGQEYVDNFMKENNMKPLQSLYVPVTTNDFQNVLTNAWDKNQAFVMYEYSFGAGSDEMRQLKENCYEAYNIVSAHYPEYSTYVSMKFGVESDNSTSSLTLGFDSLSEYYTYSALLKQQTEAEKMVKAILPENLKENGMTELQKADSIHQIVTELLQYDYGYNEKSYTAYGALTTGFGVCQGYSSVFNLLCREAGVKAAAVSNQEHMWNVVLSDGTLYHYDTTADDTDGAYGNSIKGIPDDEFVPDDIHKNYRLPDIDIMF